MQVLGIVAPSDAAALAERVAGRLEERGTVGLVRAGDPDPAGTTVYEVGGGGWRGRGPDGSLDDVLDRLARDHDYAVVAGFPAARIPTLVVGDADCRGEVVHEAAEPSGVDVEQVVASVERSEPYETLGSLVARAKRSSRAERAGAIATFTGRVRAKDAEDDAWTDRLEFEKYEGVADERLATIREELCARDGVFEVVMHHRTGVVEYGEDIVFVVVLAGHREEAFRTVEDGINRLKAEVPLFKKEVTVEEEFWVHDRP